MTVTSVQTVTGGSAAPGAATVTVTSERTVTAYAESATSSAEEPAGLTSATPAGPESTSAPTSVAAQVKMVGNAKPKLGKGIPGKVTVVAQAPFNSDSSIVPVLVRNDTDATVYDVTLTVRSTDSAGKLIGSGSDQGFRPTAVAPGQIAIGYAFFSGGSTNAESNLEFEVDHSNEPSGYTVDLPITTLNLVKSDLSGSDLVGEVTNSTSEEVSRPGISTACFDAGGALLSVDAFSNTVKDELAAGTKSAFTVNLFDKKCPSYLLAAVGSSF